MIRGNKKNNYGECQKLNDKNSNDNLLYSNNSVLLFYISSHILYLKRNFTHTKERKRVTCIKGSAKKKMLTFIAVHAQKHTINATRDTLNASCASTFRSENTYE